MVSCGALAQKNSFPLDMVVDKLREEALHDTLEMFDGGTDDKRELTTRMSEVIGRPEANK